MTSQLRAPEANSRGLCDATNILVETHGHLGALPEEIQALLEGLSYEIVGSRFADLGRKYLCIENDVVVFKTKTEL